MDKLFYNYIFVLFKLNNDLGGCSFETREDGAYVKYTLPGGADPVTKKLGSASGKLTIKYRYRLCVDYSYNSGASYSQTGEKDITGIITIVLSDGVITEYKNSGGIGNSYTVSQGNNWRGSVIGFAITSVQWEEIS